MSYSYVRVLWVQYADHVVVTNVHGYRLEKEKQTDLGLSRDGESIHAVYFVK